MFHLLKCSEAAAQEVRMVDTERCQCCAKYKSQDADEGKCDIFTRRQCYRYPHRAVLTELPNT